MNSDEYANEKRAADRKETFDLVVFVSLMLFVFAGYLAARFF